MDIRKSIREAMDANNYSIGIFLDLAKAFDTLDYSILKKKLEHYGIRRVALALITNSLIDGSKYVLFKTMSSSSLPIKCDVPHGSILGPLLFFKWLSFRIQSIQIYFIRG